jgi:3-oxoacyl-[acyl-carrier-protein] synthase III
MTDPIEKILESNGLSLDDVALFVFHQANLRIIEDVASRLNIEAARLFAYAFIIACRSNFRIPTHPASQRPI